MAFSVDIQTEELIGSNKVIEAKVGEKQVYIYFVKQLDAEQYTAYSISEKTYKKVKRGMTISKDEQECIGSMRVEEDVITWITEQQKENKVFGKLREVGNAKKDAKRFSIIFFAGCATIGLLLLGVGIYRVNYKKIFMNRSDVVEGTVTSYSHARIMGKRYADDYYSVHVKYQVDGIWYEGYNGKTTIEPKVGANMSVRYETSRPNHIVIYDDMSSYSIFFIVAGGSLLLVGIVTILPVKK